MFIRFLRATALGLVVSLPALPAPAAAAPLTLAQALDLAVARAESGRAARAGVASATETARAAGQLPDPMLRAGVDNLPVTGTDRLHSARDSMTMKRIGISQEWVSADKRAARQAAADAMVERQTTAVQAAIAEVRLQTALAYLDAYFARESLRLSELTEHHLHEEWEAARARLASSSGSSQEVLALTGARGMAEDESADARQQQGAAAVALERWTGIVADAVDAPGDATSLVEHDFVANHPTVQAATRDAAVARQGAAIAAASRQANWTWEVSYGQRTGYSDMVSLGVNIPLSIAPEQRQDRETASKLALVDKADADLAEATRAATAEFQTLVGDSRRLQDRLARYQASVIVPAGQRSAAAVAAYRSNQLSLATLFEARHAEVDAQRKLLSLRRDLARAQARLAYEPLSVGAAR